MTMFGVWKLIPQQMLRKFTLALKNHMEQSSICWTSTLSLLHVSWFGGISALESLRYIHAPVSSVELNQANPNSTPQQMLSGARQN
jgi:hypothetical protein